jgi:hypothetical protein
MVDIGSAIKKRADEIGVGSSELARRINKSRQNVQDIFERKSIDSELLALICKALDFDFFSLYRGGQMDAMLIRRIIRYGETFKVTIRLRNGKTFTGEIVTNDGPLSDADLYLNSEQIAFRLAEDLNIDLTSLKAYKKDPQMFKQKNTKRILFSDVIAIEEIPSEVNERIKKIYGEEIALVQEPEGTYSPLVKELIETKNKLIQQQNELIEIQKKEIERLKAKI